MNAKKQAIYNGLVADYEQNIVEFYNRFLTISDLQSENWYHLENENIANFAHVFNVPVNLFCGMVAVTSPLKKWQENIKWVCEIIKWCQGDTNAKVYSGIKGNANKAIRLYNDWQSGNFSDENVNRVTGDKTQAFFHNLLYPDTSLRFTVDVWMLRIVNREWQSATNVYKVNKLQIDAARHAYLNVWAKLNLAQLGVMPHMFQAACWINIKKTSVACQWLTDFDKVERFV